MLGQPLRLALLGEVMQVSAKSICIGALASLLLSLSACSLGPYPDFLEPLDALDSIKGESVTWMASDADGSYFLVLGADGSYALSRVNRTTSTETEVGSFDTVGARFDFQATRRYVFPKESGKVGARRGARSEDIDQLTSFRSELSDDVLILDELGEFRKLDALLLNLDVSQREDAQCLIRIVQSHIRISQNRIPQFGGSGTAMFIDNKAAFKGLISGEFTIVIDGLLKPITTIEYADFADFPGFNFNLPYLTFVNTSGDGRIEGKSHIEMRVDKSLSADASALVPAGAGGAGGAGGLTPRELLYELELVYGPQDALQLRSGDIVGGSYTFVIQQPIKKSYDFDWEVLEDLDMLGCGLD